MSPDPIAAGLRLLLAAARDARQAGDGASTQVEMSAWHRFPSQGHEMRTGFGMISQIMDPDGSKRVQEAVARRLRIGAARCNALLEALGPHGEAAAIDGLAWAWTPGTGFRLLRGGPTPAQDAPARWLQRTGPALARGEWPVRDEDCASAHQRLCRIQAGAWDGAAEALAAQWAWNPLLHRRPVMQLRRGQAALWHAQGIDANGPPLVLAAAAW